jgi:TolB-like protein
MAETTKPHLITIDLNQFKLHIELKNRIELTLHFNSPSRKFYLSVIAFVVNEMKRQGKITSIPLEGHHDLLALLNETIGGTAGSSEEENLLSRIYRKWQHALPNLEEAPLFMVLGKKKGYEEGIGKTYHFTEAEKDSWANLFEYKGSHENVRLKFAIDKIGATLNDIAILYEDSLNGEAWERFISGLKEKEEEKPKVEPIPLVSAEPEVLVPQLEKRRIVLSSRYRWPALIGVIVGIAAIAIWGLYIHYTPQPERTPPERTPKEKIASLQDEKPIEVVPPSTEAPERGKMIVEVGPKKVESPSPEKVSKPVTPPPPKEEVASKEKMAFPLPDEPSIAVLPFTNMSDDPQQEYFSDGITDDIITALSKVQYLFVISRHSTFSYKGKPVKVKQVSEELGVQYVLEGSIQKSGDRIRINVQLIDALIGHHIWAGRYDRDLTDLFTLQDEITLRVLTAVRVKLTEGEQVSIKEKSYEKIYKGKQGLDCYLKGLEVHKYIRGYNIESARGARRIAEEMMEMCPGNPVTYIMLGWVHAMEYYMGIGKSRQESIEKGIEMTQKALAIDDSISGAHGLLSQLYSYKREYDKAIAEGERAVALAPGGAINNMHYATCLNWACRFEEAIPIFQKAIRLDPVGNTSIYLNFGVALEGTGRFEEAVSAYKKSVQREPNNLFAHLGLASTYIKMGREKEACAEAAEVLRINPNFSLDNYAKMLPIKDQSVIDEGINLLRKTGLK